MYFSKFIYSMCAIAAIPSLTTIYADGKIPQERHLSTSNIPIQQSPKAPSSQGYSPAMSVGQVGGIEGVSGFAGIGGINGPFAAGPNRGSIGQGPFAGYGQVGKIGGVTGFEGTGGINGRFAAGPNTVYIDPNFQDYSPAMSVGLLGGTETNYEQDRKIEAWYSDTASP